MLLTFVAWACWPRVDANNSDVRPRPSFGLRVAVESTAHGFAQEIWCSPELTFHLSAHFVQSVVMKVLAIQSLRFEYDISNR